MGGEFMKHLIFYASFFLACGCGELPFTDEDSPSPPPTEKPKIVKEEAGELDTLQTETEPPLLEETTDIAQDGEEIVKFISEILIDFGMSLNPNKTKPTDQVIKGSIKPDKLYWIQQKQSIVSLQKHLLLIHSLAMQFPNSGSLINALGKFYDRLKNKNNINIYQLISIITDIAYHNPKTYPISAAIVSKLISCIGNKENQKTVIKKIRKKFDKIPNTGHLDIWLQRVAIGFNESIPFDEPICKIVANENDILIWKKNWLKENFRKKIKDKQIVNKEELDKVRGQPIKREEFAIFSGVYY